MVSLEYKQSQRDHTLFIEHFVTDKLPMLLVYVNSMIIVRHDQAEKSVLQENLAAQFKMKDWENSIVSLD